MTIVIVRGTPGIANTKIYGLPREETDKMLQLLRPGPSAEQKDEITFYNSPVNVMNQLEYHFGYRVVACAVHGQAMQPLWTLSRPF